MTLPPLSSALSIVQLVQLENSSFDELRNGLVEVLSVKDEVLTLHFDNPTEIRASDLVPAISDLIFSFHDANSITTIRFINCRFSDFCWKRGFESFSFFLNLKSLIFKNCNLNQEKISDILKPSATSGMTLQTLTISKQSFDKNALNALCSGIPQVYSLRKLILNKDQLDDDQMICLTTYGLTSSKLEEIEVRKNNISDIGIVELSLLCSRKIPLYKIDLSGNQTLGEITPKLFAFSATVKDAFSLRLLDTKVSAPHALKYFGSKSNRVITGKKRKETDSEDEVSENNKRSKKEENIQAEILREETFCADLEQEIEKTRIPEQQQLDKISQIKNFEIKHRLFEDLLKKGYLIVPILGDGNCFYNSVLQSLESANPFLRASFFRKYLSKYRSDFANEIKSFKTIDKVILLRKMLHHYIKNHITEFDSFIIKPDNKTESKKPNMINEGISHATLVIENGRLKSKDEVLEVTRSAVDKYCTENILASGSWAGDIEIRALTGIFEDIEFPIVLEIFEADILPQIIDGKWVPHDLLYRKSTTSSQITAVPVYRKNRNHNQALTKIEEVHDNILQETSTSQVFLNTTF